MGYANLSQVAREAGVSKTTASLVINGKADQVNIARATRDRVLEAARQLNYRPSRFMPGRLNGRTGLLEVIASDFSYPSVSQWLSCLIRIAGEAGYTIIPRHVDERKTVEDFYGIPADGVIFLNEGTVPEGLENIDLPFLCAGFREQGKNGKEVVPDSKAQMTQLISALYKNNKRAIGFLTDSGYSSRERLQVYQENYCDRFGIPPNVAEVPWGNEQADVIGGCCHLWNNGANGILFGNLEMAVEALSSKKVRELGERGVVLATCGYHPGFDMLPDRLLLHAPDDIEEMAKSVVKKLTGYESPPDE